MRALSQESQSDVLRNALCLDGGGLKGVYCLHVMRGVERRSDVRFMADFDLFAGTSVGGAIAVSLADGLTVDEIYDIFKEVIQPPRSRILSFLNKIYSRAEFAGVVRRLFRRIDDTFGDSRFRKISGRVILPVYNFSERNNDHFGYNSKIAADDVRIADIVKAICADIRFTKPHYLPSLNQKYCDGGVFAYDPASYVVRTCLSGRHEPTKVLSIGCGAIENLSESMNVGGTFDAMFDSFLYEQFRSTEFLFKSGTPGIVEYYRISEFPVARRVTSYQEIIELADRRLGVLDHSRLSEFRKRDVSVFGKVVRSHGEAGVQVPSSI